ncbi:glucokinase [Bacillus pakistanensis]|uniref:Glucokinase n=1 Tax=Rossellomorea pakistanensis TaxID=992288 RepID=A0ABS2NCN7_9BACI|nr:ROK family protein [Bacillus pakistanensis]MBM7585593.1 glucokinase [Bacillus pakistanensis]
MKAAVGIDIGGTKIAIGLVREDGMVLREMEFPTNVDSGPDQALNKMVQHIRSMYSVEPNIIGIGIGSPGPLDTREGKILSPPNLQTWHGYPLVKKIESAFQTKVKLMNDADAAAFAEYYYSHRSGYNHMMYVTVSTGIGGGLILNGKLYEGALSGAGEIGHMSMESCGPICGCGKMGCLESFSSGTGMMNAWKQKLTRLQQPIDPNWTGKDLFEQAASGEMTAAEVVMNGVDYLARGISQAVQLLNPELVVLGGGVILAQPTFYKQIVQRVPSYLLEHHRRNLTFSIAEQGRNAGFKGAAAIIHAENY